MKKQMQADQFGLVLICLDEADQKRLFTRLHNLLPERKIKVVCV